MTQRLEGPSTVARGRTQILIATVSSMAMLVLDSSIIGVMLPSIQRDLNLTTYETAWAVSSYLLSLAVLLPLGGRVVDAIGAATAFNLGLGGFALASAGVGFAASDVQLIAWRTLAGAAAALMMPAALAILTATFDGDARAKALATYAGFGQAFAVLGPLVGGVCAQFLTWRWAFWINVPVGIVGIALMLRARPRNTRVAVTSWDPLGVGLLIVGLTGVVLALLQVPEWGLTSPLTWVAFGIGAIALAAFVRHTLRSTHPILDLRTFRNAHFTAGAIVLFCLGYGMTVATIYGAIVLQDSLGLSPAESGLALLPLVVPLLIATKWIGHAYRRIGPRRLGIVGSGLLAIGLVTVACALPIDSVALVCIGLVPIGIGVGLLLSPMTNATLSVVEPDVRGAAAGIVSTSRQLGSIIGVGVISALIAALPSTSAGSGLGLGAVLGFLAAAALMVVAAIAAATGFKRLPEPTSPRSS